MVANEFFEQGDLEKERLNVTPAVSCIFRLFLFVLHEKNVFLFTYSPLLSILFRTKNLS